jgi:hypothetical protein
MSIGVIQKHKLPTILMKYLILVIANRKESELHAVEVPTSMTKILDSKMCGME